MDMRPVKANPTTKTLASTQCLWLECTERGTKTQLKTMQQQLNISHFRCLDDHFLVSVQPCWTIGDLSRACISAGGICLQLLDWNCKLEAFF